MTKPPSNIMNLPIEDRAQIALNAAVENVIVEHARLGMPLHVIEGGKVIQIRPEKVKQMAEELLAS
jgi:hypothetical protein